MTLKKEPVEPVSKYIERAKSLWSDLIATGYDMKETELCWAVLLGLPIQFDMMRTILMSRADELSIDAIYPQLLQVQQHKSEDEKLVPIFGAMSKMHISKQRKCHHCGKPGHLQAQCRLKVSDEHRLKLGMHRQVY